MPRGFGGCQGASGMKDDTCLKLGLKKWLPPTLAAILLMGGILYFLWYDGAFLPGWINWRESLGTYRFGEEEALVALLNQRVSVSLNKEQIWQSGKDCRVSDCITEDVDHDGKNELILLFWRHGSFGDHLPFWIRKNDSDWSQHIGIYDWKESYPYRLDPIWVSSGLGIEISELSADEDGIVTVTDKNGRETRWYWRTFGLMLLEEGEKPVVSRTEGGSPAGKGMKEQKALRAGETKKTISFTASGDNLIHEAIIRSAKDRALKEGKEGYDFDFAYEEVSGFFRAHDINFINVESLITETLPPSDYPDFSTPADCGMALLKAGFNALNLSNNHIYDKGSEGINATLDFWSDKEAAVFGLYDRDDPMDICVYEYDGVRLAFLGYTYGTNGRETPEGSDKRAVYLSETELIKKQLEKARREADIVIVSCHFGAEGSHRITDGERTLGRALAGWGADLVIGTHPHVIKDAQWINTGDGRRALVCYSLGNFLSSMKRTGNLLGLTLECSFEVPKSGPARIKNARLIPNVTVYGPYYREPHVKWFSDYSSKEARDNRAAYRDIDYSYDRLTEILKENVSEQFLGP